jgi:hypothetical protein
MGSTFVALKAGTYDAMSAIAPSTTGTAMKVIGSVDEMPNSLSAPSCQLPAPSSQPEAES